jgi:ligand-binding sensor domain-containing protein
MFPAIKKISSFLIIAIQVLCILVSASLAQVPGYRNFLLEEDNRRVRINCIYKALDGYIFAGTANGLYKFDGENFKKIYFLNKDYNDTVTAIFQDNEKKIWVGFLNGRLAHLINNQLQYYNPEEGLPQKKITAIQQDKEKNIWYASYGEGLYYISNNKNYLVNAENGLSDLNVSSIAVTRQNDILAATDQGINICSGKGVKKTISVVGPAQGLPDYMVTQITQCGDDSFWVALQDKGFCLYDHTSKKITVPAIAAGWKYGQVNSLLQDEDILWIATQDAGILQYSLSSQKLIAGPAMPGNMSQLLRDNQGNIWIASADGGLTRTPGNATHIYPLYPASFFEIIHAILYDSRGNIWVNDDMGILRFSPREQSFDLKRFAVPGLDYAADITALYEDKFKNIWIGTMGKGLYVFNPETGKMRHLFGDSSFKNASVLSLGGKDDEIFVCSLQGAAAIKLTQENRNINSVFHFNPITNINTGARYIYSIYKDKKNRLWYATDGMGLMMEENGKFNYYNEEKKIRDRHIYSVTEDNAGNIWFSTATGGIYSFNGKIFTNYGIKEGLSNLSISAIKKINSGHIVIVHKKGMDVLNPETGRIFYINANTGLGIVNADNLGAVTTDSAGKIYIATREGIVSYYVPLGASQKPFTVIESVQLFLKETDTVAAHRFSHAENNLSFHYTGLYYNDPTHVYYQYMMEGLDTAWILTRDRSQVFPKLEPGKYRFRIQSSLNRNFKDAHEASYSFVIAKPFYKTWWFILAVILSVCTLFFWYLKSREKAIRRIQLLNAEKVQFQFEVLRNQVNPHFLFNSFNTLISFIEEDPATAVTYTEQLSDFFRNIVAYRDKEIIPLQEEITLLQTYFFLQQKRYGDNLSMKIDLTNGQKQQYLVPPLTLQLLVENAIKHNSISVEQQLTIHIFIDNDGNLTVENNKNKRSSMSAAGAGMGLQNIAGRFRILTGKSIKITDREEVFIIQLPLIKTEHA